jgi:hypothetical protein
MSNERISVVARTPEGFLIQARDGRPTYTILESTNMATATVAPPVVSKAKRKKLRSNDRPIFILGAEGIVVSSINESGKIKPLGIINEAEFVEALAITPNFTSEFLHKNVLWYKKSTLNNVVTYDVVYQFDPQIITIKRKVNEQEVNRSISLPFVQFLYSFRMVENRPVTNKSFISCSPKSVSSVTDQLYSVPLHNIYPDGRICWGNGNSIDSAKMTPFEYGYKLSQRFFTSPFNTDLRPLPVSEITNYEDWENKTKANPSFIMSVGFNRVGTIQSLLGV